MYVANSRPVGQEGAGVSPGRLPATCGGDWLLHRGPPLPVDMPIVQLLGGGGSEPLLKYLPHF